ncbi:MAG: ribbon-helix-helix protein, CopG family [Chloroflexi bacterium]|nr:ribbon-helix-helix protein, CopG family [Chloroflexota bacterium]
MVMKVEKLTISLPKDLIALTDKIAKERGISRSKVVSACLQEFAEKRLRAEMEEGYRAMAEEQKRFAKMSFELQRRTVPKWE